MWRPEDGVVARDGKGPVRRLVGSSKKGQVSLAQTESAPALLHHSSPSLHFICMEDEELCRLHHISRPVEWNLMVAARLCSVLTRFILPHPRLLAIMERGTPIPVLIR